MGEKVEKGVTKKVGREQGRMLDTEGLERGKFCNQGAAEPELHFGGPNRYTVPAIHRPLGSVWSFTAPLWALFPANYLHRLIDYATLRAPTFLPTQKQRCASPTRH